MVVTAGIVHGTWGAILLFSDAPLHTTPLGHFPFKVGSVAGPIYILATIMAFTPHSKLLSNIVRRLWSGCPKRLDDNYAGLLLTLPQQGLLMLSFFTAAVAIWQGRYPDGYVPDKYGDPRFFIFVDQLWPTVGMLLHSVSLLDWYWWSRRA